MSQYEDNDADDFLLNAGQKGPRAAVFPNVGAVVEGYILERPKKTEQRDIATNEIKRFPNSGDPMMQVLIKLQTTLRDPDSPDDDGRRTLYAKNTMTNAIGEAMRAAGAKRLEVGGFLQVGRTADIPPKQRGYQPTKNFVAKYTPPASQAADDMFNQPQQAAEPQFSSPPGNGSGPVVFETQHQAQPVSAGSSGGMTTLDQLKNTSFNAQGDIQNQAPPF